MNVREKYAIYDQMSEEPVYGLQAVSRLLSVQVIACLDDTVHI